jgi:protein gp37
MATKIEWTNETWNPIAGCSLASPGCTNCYAMKMAHRVGPNFPHYAGLTKLTKGGPVWTGKIAEAPEHIFAAPLRWKRPRMVFVNSMSDLFHEDVADEVIDRVFAVMALCDGTRTNGRHHTFQVLTKRAERMHRYMTDPDTPYRVNAEIVYIVMNGYRPTRNGCDWTPQKWPLPNVWLGVSAEDQRRADERIPLLLDTPAAVRFISAEPLLGPLDLSRYLYRLGWCIAGGESGAGARPSHPDWFRSLRGQCAGAGIPFFFKQWGEWAPGEAFGMCSDGPVSDRNGNVRDWAIRYVQCEDRADRLRAYSFTQHSTKLLYRVGKKRAGALLDGREHREFPR